MNQQPQADLTPGQLTELAALRLDGGPVPAARVLKRGRALARRRRRRTAVGTALAVAGVLGGALVVPWARDHGWGIDRRTNPAVRDVAPTRGLLPAPPCSSGSATNPVWLRPPEAPDLLYLLDAGLAGAPLTQAWARAEAFTCPTTSTPAAWPTYHGAHVDATGTVVSTYTLERAPSPAEYPITVRGVPGHMLILFGSGYVSWQEAGQTWTFSVTVHSGKPQLTQLLADVEALRRTPTGFTRTSLPRGFELTSDDETLMKRTGSRVWLAEYGAGASRPGGLDLTINRAGSSVSAARVGDQFVTLNGTRVLLSGLPDGRVTSARWEDAAGRRFELTSEVIPRERAIALVRSVAPVSPDDPRLRDLPAAPTAAP